jgi:hypothetical protein
MTSPLISYPFTEDGLRSALRALGTSGDVVARNLDAMGFKGCRSHSANCPVANYVLSALPTPDRSGRVRRAYALNADGVKLDVDQPSPVEDFVEMFDNGRLADLEAPMRLRDRLRSWSKAERHRRKVERELWSPLPPVRADETGEFERIAAGIEAWKTGEFPIVAEIVPERPGIFVYAEEIGPQPPTVDEQFAAFEADPLGAALPGAPAKDDTFYRDLIERRAPAISPEVLANLEDRTGYWRADDFKKIAERGRR